MISTQKIGVQATKLLKQYDIFQAPVDIFGLVESMGLSLIRQPMEDEMSGFIKIENDDAAIAINSSHHINRQRFTAAHELGHYCLHREASDEPLVFMDESFSKGIVDSRKGAPRRVFNRDNESSLGINQKEVEANRFAASLLMPEQLIEEYVDRWNIDISSDYHIQRLASKFEVSQQALTLRLASLGVNYV